MAPLVSVIVPTYNRPALLRHTLVSVAGQQDIAAGDVEVIVVNDGGCDVELPVVAAAERGLQVRLINQPRNLGLPAARNAGLDVARGEYVTFLDDDDVFLPKHLATMLAALSNSGADVAYGTCIVSDTRIDPTNPRQLPPVVPEPAYPFDADRLSVSNFLPVHTAVLRRPPAGARFDPALPALKDWDMWLRLVREHGYQFEHVPRATVVYHRIPGDSSMCGSTMDDSAALAGFGRLVERIWRRWPAATPAAQRFRLWIAAMYWQAFAMLAERQSLPDNYYFRCVGHLAAVWHGEQPEDALLDRISESIRDGAGARAAS